MSSKEEGYRNSLLDTLRKLEDKASDFVYAPGKDFTRRRKLPFFDTMKAVIIMEGNSLNKELCDIFNFNTDGSFISKSAFVQRRNRIKPEAFEAAFRIFNERTACNDLNLYDGHRLLAVDGSDVNIALNKNSATYFPPTSTHKKNCFLNLMVRKGAPDNNLIQGLNLTTLPIVRVFAKYLGYKPCRFTGG